MVLVTLARPCTTTEEVRQEGLHFRYEYNVYTSISVERTNQVEDGTRHVGQTLSETRACALDMNITYIDLYQWKEPIRLKMKATEGVREKGLRFAYTYDIYISIYGEKQSGWRSQSRWPYPAK